MKAVCLLVGLYPASSKQRLEFGQYYDRNVKTSRDMLHMKHCSFLLRKAGLEGSPLDLNALFAFPRSIRKRMGGLTRRKLIQLSMFGRALPIGSKALSDKAILKLIEINTSECDVSLPPSFEEAITTSGILKSVRKKVPNVYLSPGATTTSSRRAGGFTNDVMNIMAPRSKEIVDRFSVEETPRVSAGPQIRLREDPRVSNIPLEPEVDRYSVPIVISEQGYKARIVTKSQPGVLYHGHRARTRTFPVLYAHRATRVPLQEGELRLKGDVKAELYSADLSNATDYLSYDTIIRVCRLLDIDPGLVKSHRYKVGSTFHVPKRGTFMGLPPSWVVLSVAHLGICLMVDPTGKSFYIKGDDLVALWTPTQWEYYLSLMTDAGFKINLKKSFVSKDKGFFCEKSYTLRKGVLVDDNVVSIRFVTKPQDSRESVPKWAVQSKRLFEVRNSVPGRFYNWLRMEIIRRSPKEILPRYYELPHCFGGLHLPKWKNIDLKRPINSLETKIVSALHDGHIRPLEVTCFHSRTASSAYVEKTLKGLNAIRRYYVSPPSDLDVISLSDISDPLTIRENKVAMMKGHGSSVLRCFKSTYLTSRKKLLTASRSLGNRLDHQDWSLGNLYFTIQGPYVPIADVNTWAKGTGSRFYQEYTKGLIVSECETIYDGLFKTHHRW